MISVTDAKKMILDATSASTPTLLPLQKAAGLVIAEDIFSPIDIPSFDQSSMDGYAFSFAGWKEKKILPVKGEMAAGSDKEFELSPGSAVRIFTGAAVPKGADTVVMQEKTKVENDQLLIEDENITQGLNIRLRGSEIKKAELAIPKDTVLLPAAVGFLAGLGIKEVKVYASPAIGIIVTGNELQKPGQPLQAGQIYESNSYTLQAALKQMHIDGVTIYTVEDSLQKVKHVLGEALQKNDIVFLTGGVSVGDYDFVVKAAEENGVEKIFHKIKQKPGKPLFFGRKESKLVFGLPGNPASVLTCFYEYAEPALRKMRQQKTGMRILQASLATEFMKAAGLTHFLKGFYEDGKVTPLTAQESYRLSSFAKANCLIKIDEDVTSCQKDDLVEIHLLPE